MSFFFVFVEKKMKIGSNFTCVGFFITFIFLDARKERKRNQIFFVFVEKKEKMGSNFTRTSFFSFLF